MSLYFFLKSLFFWELGQERSVRIIKLFICIHIYCLIDFNLAVLFLIRKDNNEEFQNTNNYVYKRWRLLKN